MADLQWTEEREKRFHADVLLGLPVQVADAEALLQERERLATMVERVRQMAEAAMADRHSEKSVWADSILRALTPPTDGGDR